MCQYGTEEQVPGYLAQWVVTRVFHQTRRAEVGTAGLVWWDKIEAWCLGWWENEAVVLVAQKEEVEAACLGQWEVEAVGVVAQREEAEAACPEWWEVEAVIISAQREEFKVALLG